jgi:hypothetical protein
MVKLKPAKPTARSRADALARRKGREQRAAAEKGNLIGFYAKELAAKAVRPRKQSGHFAR